MLPCQSLLSNCLSMREKPKPICGLLRSAEPPVLPPSREALLPVTDSLDSSCRCESLRVVSSSEGWRLRPDAAVVRSTVCPLTLSQAFTCFIFPSSATRNLPILFSTSSISVGFVRSCSLRDRKSTSFFRIAFFSVESRNISVSNCSHWSRRSMGINVKWCCHPWWSP